MRQWQRIERIPSDEEMSDWGTPEYFAAIGFDQPEKRHVIGMAEADRLYKQVLWYRSDARRLHPTGLGYAEKQVDRLFRHVSHENGKNLEIDPALFERRDAFWGNHLKNDLEEMGICPVRNPPASSGRRIVLSQDNLIQVLSHFDVVTVETVCDRRLLCAHTMEIARKTRQAGLQRNRVLDREVLRGDIPPSKSTRDRDGYEL